MNLHFHVGWPQGIYLGLIALGIVINALKQGQFKVVEFDVKARLLGAAILLPLLYWGGFFG